MSSSWRGAPRTKLGWASLSFAGITIILWASMPAIVQIRERVNFSPEAGLIVVAGLGIFALLAIVLGVVSIGFKKDKSVLLLIGTCLVSGILILAVVGEVVEAILMS